MKHLYQEFREDIELERLGNFYCSEFVTENMPWIRKLPFYEWLDRVKEGNYMNHNEVHQSNSNKF